MSTSEGEVCVCSGAEGVADDEESYVFGVGVCQNFLAGGFDHFAVGEDDRAAIVGLLLRADKKYDLPWTLSCLAHQMFLVDQ